MKHWKTAALALMTGGCAGPMASGGSDRPVTVGVVAINDFHGALEPPRQAALAPDGKGGTVQVPAGGAAWLASAIDTIRARHAHHVTVSAGDLIGASQFASSIHLDESAIGVMNRIGLEFNAVGNHEFDRGRAELLRMQEGGCARHTARAPCQVEKFAGARFRFLSASTRTERGTTLFPAHGYKHFGRGRTRVTVGFIGLTLKGTPDLVAPEGIRGLTFEDEAQAINRLVPKLKAKGADAVVVLIHQGGRTGGLPDPDRCEGLQGELLPILAKLDSRVDVVVSGHTHWAYVCEYPRANAGRPLLLTSGGLYGQLVTDIRLEIDPRAGKVVSRSADNVIVQSPGYTSGKREVVNSAAYPRFAPRADIAAYVKRYTDAASAFSRRPAGRLSAPAARPGGASANRGGPLGNLIADAHLAATRTAGARIAFTNPFGIRAPIHPAADGSVTYGELYAVQPFNNALVTQTMTGAQIKAALEQGLDANGPEQLLSPSAGFTYRFDRSRPEGERIVAMMLDGEPVRPDEEYRVTTNAFLAAGGDSFTAFAPQRQAVQGMSDIDALEAWLKGDAPRLLPEDERVGEGPAR